MRKTLLLLAFIFSSVLNFAQQKGKDYLTKKTDGKVYWIRSGQPIQIMIDVPLKNGSVINYKGMIKSKDGQVIELKKGEKVMMDGTIIKNKK